MRPRFSLFLEKKETGTPALAAKFPRARAARKTLGPQAEAYLCREAAIMS